ncbi:Negative regulator of SacY activity [Bacillus subtilis]|uniref:PTS system sucrose transporter subunit IIBC n=1 Tax=Bacillus TaxID=1386 RepID=UPI00136407F3|nr:PTS system sucrose transporter subunit IIBC [Bacillus subtilis]MBU8720893.1 PTS system sucrose transporter subunit IIBC [Bacillus subtilis]MCB7162078.1 PTS system sucrose transporter subunit IIBC [Bacillus subtilis]MCB7460234.1 PTS system sucrose transporter subunit IIBC [Bacillus subtilis]MED4557015.1 PTS system sucrose transporter subunit IIBC [Bacillus subtilis]QHJ96454.1 Negative regulator of SacY activity [Bacillus subtilis]
MDYKETAKRLIELLGGKENIISAAHCATRLRLVMKDESKIDQAQVEELDGVKGAFSSSGQYQIIFGTGLVNKVFDAFSKEADIEREEHVNHQDAAKEKLNPAARFAKTLSNIFVPIIPAIVASGLLMGLLGMINAFHWMSKDSALLQLLDMFSSAAFIFLPILIGVSASKEFGSNPYLGAVIGGIMIHPSLLNPWGLAEATPDYMHLFGFDIALLGYQGTVIPILLAVYVMSKVEKWTRKVVPHAVDLLVTPFVTVIVTGFVAFIAIGPLGRALGSGITVALTYVYDHAGFVAGLIFGGTYSLIVLTGVHHSFHAIEAGLIADIGKNYLLPIWSMANVAQGGAGLAVFFMAKKAKTKEIALPAAFSAFLGITEPVIFGVNLRYRKPFIAAMIGGALGGAYVVFTHVAANAYGLTGIPMIAIAAPFGVSNLIHYLIGMAIAAVSAFIAAFVMKINEDEERKK